MISLTDSNGTKYVEEGLVLGARQDREDMQKQLHAVAEALHPSRKGTSGWTYLPQQLPAMIDHLRDLLVVADWHAATKKIRSCGGFDRQYAVVEWGLFSEVYHFNQVQHGQRSRSGYLMPV